MEAGLYSEYLRYVGLSESPTIYHRWALTSAIAALLGRQVHLPFGHSKIYPNHYVMLMGSPGVRKSTAINLPIPLLKAAGYCRFAADRTSKERFLIDMQREQLSGDFEGLEDLTLDEPCEIYVVAEEFTDFVGANNMDFITALTKLWDCPSEYKHPKIHGKSVVVTEPTVNIIGGNTAQGFALAFPPEALGNGFLSRLIFVHGEESGKKITFPALPDEVLKAWLVDFLKEIKAKVKGVIKLSQEAEALCHVIYKKFHPIDDHRFRAYSSRRFTHLLKLAMIMAASAIRTVIEKEDILRANALLHYTELKMPKALGEFGKSKYSDVGNTILDVLGLAKKPVTLNELWKYLSKDLSRISELGDILNNLRHAGKVQIISMAGKQGFLPVHERKETWDKDLISDSWLTDEEKS